MPPERVFELWERHHRRAREARTPGPALEPLAADEPGFRMRYAYAEGGPVLEVAGELGLENVSQLSEAVSDVLGPEDLHLDLRLVTFSDSTGLNALVAIKTAADAMDVGVRISASSVIRRIIEVTGLVDTLLE